LKLIEERQDEFEKEKNRIKGGKEAQEAKKLWEQKTKEREEALKRKEKEEEKKAKARIKAKIEQDRLEREAAKKKSLEGEGIEQKPTEVVPKSTEIVPPQKKEYFEALIQIRFKDGNTIKATFKPTDPVRTVFDHVALLLNSQNFSLMTNFPKKVFSPKDSSMDFTTLAQAELVPTGTFIIQ